METKIFSDGFEKSGDQYRRRDGTRRICGTDHPITRIIERSGKRGWVAFTLCNGLADSEGTRYKSLKRALEQE